MVNLSQNIIKVLKSETSDFYGNLKNMSRVSQRPTAHK